MCGVSIFDHLFGSTRRVAEPEPDYRTAPLETRYLVDDASVIIRVDDAPTPIRFSPDQPMILGRINNQNPRKPDIDLTAYRAFERGVSCRHASIQRQDNRLMIADLGSTNGTCVNGKRLAPHEACPLNDGDELRLGNLFMRVFF
jgi:pSer/pThr/pTyr-binding forkhead associated (FHA) protein